MTTSRIVRFTDAFFERLDELLPEERDADGMLSVTDFLVFEVPPISKRLSRDFEGATLSTDDEGIRLFVGRGLFVPNIAVFARLEPDGSVAAFWLSLDT
ncbi:MAG: hypothetical protein LH616_06400 [Ilumatobacteraceae bacterium]|nr:hypothetical protein [Ilumatobacteraceae bacterium]